MVIIWWDTDSATSKSKTSTRQLLSGRAWENLSGRAKTFWWTQDQPFGTGLNILADPETASWRRFVPGHLIKFYQSDLLKNLLVSFFWFHPARRACYWVTYLMYFFSCFGHDPSLNFPPRKKKKRKGQSLCMKLLHSDDLHYYLGSICCCEKSKTSRLGFKSLKIKREVKHDIRKGEPIRQT